MTQRAVTTLQLTLFNLGILLFALIPFETLILAEQVYATMAGVALVAVILHNWNIGKWTRKAYLLTGWIGATMFLVYEYYAWIENGPLSVRVGIGLFLLSGAASAYGAHLVESNGLD